MSRREYLGIYIYARPKNEMEREFNNDMLMKAEAIRFIRGVQNADGPLSFALLRGQEKCEG